MDERIQSYFWARQYCARMGTGRSMLRHYKASGLARKDGVREKRR